MKNTMDDLRNHLFVTIEGLLDTEQPLDLEKAKAINQTAQTLISSAKVEVQFLDVTGQASASPFFQPKHNNDGALGQRQLKQ